MKAITKKIFKNPWVRGIGSPLIVLFITDVIFKQNWIGKGWSWMHQFLLFQLHTRIWVILTIISTLLFFFFLFRWIKQKYFHKEWNSKIGNYTFKQLHTIMRTEHIYQSNSALIYQDYSSFNLLQLFDVFHSRISAGATLDGDLFLYHDLCPRLHMFGLMDKTDAKSKYADIIEHHYTLNENGKKFWAVLNKLSIKHRLKAEKMKEVQQKLKVEQSKPQTA